jgi:crotonobetainyl-CoA:carnitine CoA-transferase CaiB-like acyl-CoA transferase
VNWKIVSDPLLKTTAADKAVREWQAVPAIDGHVALVYMERDWPAVVELISDDRLRKSCFATRQARLVNFDALMDVLRPWFAVRRKTDIYREARRRSIPLGPIWTISDLLRDAQYLERDFLATIPAGVMPRLPVMWNGHRPRSAERRQQPIGSTVNV